MKLSNFGLLIFLLIGTAACTPKYLKNMTKQKVENPTTQAEKDQNIIIDYLVSNEINAQKTASGLWYTIEAAGDTAKPDNKCTVTAHYNGTLLDSTKFDNSYDRGEPLTFGLGQVIVGWQEAIQLLGKGGKGTFYIPSGLAYGEQGAGEVITPNTVLKFDIELLDFEKILTPKERTEKEQTTIKQYLAENNLEATQLPSGIWFVMTQAGSGAKPSPKATVTAHYEGRLLNGDKFDASYDRGQPFTTTLDRVIAGWREAIPTLQKGGKGTFFIPSALAYGERGAGTIPANSILVFDIELLDFEEPLSADGQTKKDQALITKYLADNNIKAEKTASGLWYVITTKGNGESPTVASTVKTHYKGTLLDGKVFDSSYDRNQPLEFPLGQVIAGWQEAIPMLSKGGKGTFFIPSALGYGTRGAGGVIPPNAVLIFEVELLDFK
jgi:FKBP-type peptidyl-prolyl cis-trans isomerase FkpA